LRRGQRLEEVGRAGRLVVRPRASSTRRVLHAGAPPGGGTRRAPTLGPLAARSAQKCRCAVLSGLLTVFRTRKEEGRVFSRSEKLQLDTSSVFFFPGWSGAVRDARVESAACVHVTSCCWQCFSSWRWFMSSELILILESAALVHFGKLLFAVWGPGIMSGLMFLECFFRCIGVDCF